MTYMFILKCALKLVPKKYPIPKNSYELKILNDSVAYFKVPSFVLTHFHGQYSLKYVKN